MTSMTRAGYPKALAVATPSICLGSLLFRGLHANARAKKKGRTGVLPCDVAAAEPYHLRSYLLRSRMARAFMDKRTTKRTMMPAEVRSVKARIDSDDHT